MQRFLYASKSSPGGNLGNLFNLFHRMIDSIMTPTLSAMIIMTFMKMSIVFLFVAEI
ncbi:MAG: hypothetical protein P8I80_03145 [Bacteroidales bacterium]|jgi:hypothetical protein|nr:hypothetical protein [Bacteroidales bacterium]